MPNASTPSCDTASLFSTAETLVPEQENPFQRFTAIGRPIPNYKSSALANANYDSTCSQAPQFLPQKFTDDSLLKIPIPYSDLPVSTQPNVASSQVNIARKQKERKKSFIGKMGGLITGKDKSETNCGGFRMVEMTRKEYLMYWAKDEKGEYIGTEPRGVGVQIWKARRY